MPFDDIGVLSAFAAPHCLEEAGEMVLPRSENLRTNFPWGSYKEQEVRPLAQFWT